MSALGSLPGLVWVGYCEGSEVNQKEPSHDDRSPLAKGFDLASRIIVAGAGFGLLAWGGYWLDRRLGWNGPLLAVGAAIGGLSFFWQMLKLVQELNRRD